MKKYLAVLTFGATSLFAQISNPGAGGTGTVTGVLGTANQIASDGNSVTPTLSIVSGFILPGTINKLTLTQPATGSTLTIADGKTLTATNTMDVAKQVGVAGGIPWYDTTTSQSASALLTAGGIVLGGGAGAAPLTSADFTASAGKISAGSAGGTAGSIGANGSSSGSWTLGCTPTTTCTSGSTTAPFSFGKVTGGTAGTTPGFIDLGAGYTTTAMSAQSTATCTNVTNMTWNILANKRYILSCEVPITLAASATVQFCLGGPGTATGYSLEADGPIGAAGAYAQISTLAQTAYQTKTNASSAVGAAEWIHVKANIQNGGTASGTALTLQTAANGTNNITVGQDASCTLTQQN